MIVYLIRRLGLLAIAGALIAAALFAILQIVPRPGPAADELLESWVVSPDQPVAELIGRSLPDTLVLIALGLALGLLLSLPLGLASVSRRAAALGRLAGGISLLGLAVPLLVVAGLLALWLALPIDPAQPDQGLGQQLLPALVLGLLAFLLLLRLTRSALLRRMDERYILAARARGVPERALVARHALRNSLRPRGLAWLLLGLGLFGGAVLVETLFELPGAGRLTVEALRLGDWPLALALLGVFAALTLLLALLWELLYAVTTPSIRSSRSR